MKEIIKSQRLGEEFLRIKHKSGLTLLLCPMKGYSSAYALFGTEYGSVESSFIDKDGALIQIPAGTAHFLEHKMFESEEGDAFALYAKTGASANAYTSFDKTAYLFSCSDNFKESLSILMHLVTEPYFTPQTVEKEQGIIGQEIKMYDDSPEWRVMFNLMEALFEKHPLKIDIAGTVDTIAQITADTLYTCYNAFYNLNNMALAIAGNFEVQDVLDLADEILKPAEPMTAQRILVDEPAQVVKHRVEQQLPVATPLFQIGFKAVPKSKEENLINQVYDEILLDTIAGEHTALYRSMYDEGIINSTFVGEVMAGRDFAVTLFEGESRDPDKVYEALCGEIRRMQREGIDRDAFERSRRAIYGRYLGMYARVDSVASLMLTTQFGGADMYTVLEAAAGATYEMLTARLLEAFDPERSALSVVTAPKEA
ncbi:EF-P 5-aminopentanol modification-associated protein YfmH [Merdimmobilis hominis]|jgi:predicted Zn-dependent peptidase|uniref:EF-P 5-aminopentanol modification-associated protein YfmH n=1 Tax=Merdimmobilis hominis TaxID=2897707 RepID=UPI0006C7D2DF|nr:pitrilysin family protein [Merdimmobilis hominis]PWL58705.1 MAG: insulinase family protein [Oscillospiraceae bacterium]